MRIVELKKIRLVRIMRKLTGLGIAIVMLLGLTKTATADAATAKRFSPLQVTITGINAAKNEPTFVIVRPQKIARVVKFFPEIHDLPTQSGRSPVESKAQFRVRFKLSNQEHVVVKVLDTNRHWTWNRKFFDLKQGWPQFFQGLKHNVDKKLGQMVRYRDRVTKTNSALDIGHYIRFLTELELPADKAVPELARYLNHSAYGVPAHAMNALKPYGSSAKQTLPVLIDIYQRTNQPKWIANAAADAMSAIGPDDRRVIATLVDGLSDPRHKSKSSIPATIRALGQAGPSAKQALPLLQPYLKSHGESVFNYKKHTTSQFAHQAIWRIHGSPIARWQEIGDARSLDQISPTEKYSAFEALRLAGPQAAAAIPSLIRIVKQDSRPHIRYLAIASLASVGRSNPDAVRTVLAAIDSEYGMNSHQAMQAAKLIDPTHQPTVTVLAESLQADNQFRRDAAIQALRKFGPLAVSAVPQITQMLSTEIPRAVAGKTRRYVWRKGLDVLRTLGPKAHSAEDWILSQLKAMQRHPRIGNKVFMYRFHVHAYLLVTLAEIGPSLKSRPAILRELERARTEKPLRYGSWITAAACYAAGELRAKGRPAVRHLITLVKTADADKILVSPFTLTDYGHESTLQIEAIRALGRIGAPADSAIAPLKTIAAQTPKRVAFIKVCPFIENRSDRVTEARRALQRITES